MCNKDYIDVIKLANEQFPLTKQIDGLDEAIIGLSIRIPNTTNFIYSLNKIISVIMTKKQKSYDDAIFYFESDIIIHFDEKDETSPMVFDDRPHFSLN
tara:strand:- start:158 stop:451 length:294 start_codon:yes stop_codon:yes gene_type:complete